MHELMSKTKFINALVREHVAIEDERKVWGRNTDREYLRLELIALETAYHLVIRGNRMGTYWMIWEQRFQNTEAGFRQLHKAAVDIAFTAAMKTSVKVGYPVQIGMPAVSYSREWF